MWLQRGEPVRWSRPWGRLDNGARLEEDGTVLITNVRVDRVFLIAGLFCEIQMMNVGGTRVLQIAPAPRISQRGRTGSDPAERRSQSGTFSALREGHRFLEIASRTTPPHRSSVNAESRGIPVAADPAPRCRTRVTFGPQNRRSASPEARGLVDRRRLDVLSTTAGTSRRIARMS